MESFQEWLSSLKSNLEGAQTWGGFDYRESIWDAFVNIFVKGTESIFDYFGEFILAFTRLPLLIVEMDYPKQIFGYAMAVSLMLVVAKAMNEGIATYLLYTEGDSDSDLGTYLVRIGQTIAVIVSLRWIVLEIYQAGINIATDIAMIAPNSNGGKYAPTDFATMFIGLGNSITGVTAILCFAGAVMLLVILYQSALRAVELVKSIFVGYVLALNLTTTSRDMWKSYIKNVVVLSASPGLQIFLLGLAIHIWNHAIDYGIELESYKLVLVVAVIHTAMKAPKSLQTYVHSTGAGGVVSSAARTGVQMIMMRRR